MAKLSNSLLTAYLLVDDQDKKLSPFITAVKDVFKEIGGRVISSERKISSTSTYVTEIAKCDLVIAEVSGNNPNTYYGIGLAEALGKVVIQFNQAALPDDFRLSKYFWFNYDLSVTGIESLKSSLRLFLKDYNKNPSRFALPSVLGKKVSESSFIIDLEKLDPREFDNLCFELISQMGFRKVNWGKDFKEVDLVATLPKKDPDGYEYQELWMIVTGNRAPSERLLEMVMFDPEFLVERLQRIVESPDLFSRSRMKTDGPLTILFIFREGDKRQEFFEKEFDRVETRLRNRKLPINIRIRSWDSSYLTNLIQKYPQIAYKYFSEESRIRSKYRKTPEELYNENVTLSDTLLLTTNELKEEKRKRFIAERDMAWKDVAFKAAHKLGNPIYATDTFLQRLKARIEDKDWKSGKEIADHMDTAIEEAKSVIAQFKSLTKLEEITPVPYDITKIIKQSCKTAQEQGVNVKFDFETPMPNVLIDPERLVECFNELVANSLHWFDDKRKKEILITVKKANKKELPQFLEAKNGYLKICFQDNGKGVDGKNKEKIFSPFFTTYDHGSGLGLAILKKTIDLHGGYVTEKGKFGEGALFEIFLQITKKNNK